MKYKHLEVTYNGEIYNFVELREELKILGYVFDSNSDTEVLIKAWDFWGSDCLVKLNGMFAFSVINKITNELWLVRDRYGVKPLFYGHQKNKKLIFSSSASFIGEFLNSKINKSYCSRSNRYKVFETKGSESAFNNVNSVQSGCYVKFNLNQKPFSIEETIWYDLPIEVEKKKNELKNMSPLDLYEECMVIFQDAVNIRLRSDVPLAVSLSGGLDSSSIASYASTQVDGLEGFCFGSPDSLSTEGPIVSKFSELNNIKDNYIWPNYNKADIKSMFYNTLSAQEAPFGGLSVMAQFEVYKSVKESGFKVLLGGQGGDEAFAGYRKFFITAIREAFFKKKLVNSLSFFYSFLRLLLSEISFMGNYLTAYKRYSTTTDSNNILNFDSEPLDLWGKEKSNLSNRQIEDFTQFSIPTLLRFEDRNSMANSVESRLPFMDFRLVEFGLAIPSNLKIKNGYGKWVIREAMKYQVPNFIRLERKKRGFDVTKSWVDDGVGDALRDIILPKKDNIEEYIHPDINLEKVLSNNNMNSNKLILDEAIMLAWLCDPFKRNQ
jgi:asparagine synthase (glutamine-hydrolysing)